MVIMVRLRPTVYSVIQYTSPYVHVGTKEQDVKYLMYLWSKFWNMFVSIWFNKLGWTFASVNKYVSIYILESFLWSQFVCICCERQGVYVCVRPRMLK